MALPSPRDEPALLESGNSGPAREPVAAPRVPQYKSQYPRFLGLVSVLLMGAFTIMMSQFTKAVQLAGLQSPFFTSYVLNAAEGLCVPVAMLFPGANLGVLPPLRTVVCFLPLWVITFFFFVYATQLAQPSLVQTLFGVTPAATVLLSRLVLGERLTTRTILAVCFSFIGVAAVSSVGWSALEHGNLTLVLGCGLALSAVLCDAGFKVAMKATFQQPMPAAAIGFVGSLCFATAVLGLPVTILLSAMGVEQRWWSPEVPVRWDLLGLACAMELLQGVTFSLAVAVASPVYVAAGTVLTIPASLVVDLLLRDVVPTPLEGFGAVLVVCSFGLVAFRKQP